MFGPTSEALPPTSTFGFPQQNLQTMTFQSGLPSISGGAAPHVAVDGLDMQQEGANQYLDEEGSQELLGNGNGAGDDVSRQRERNRCLPSALAVILQVCICMLIAHLSGSFCLSCGNLSSLTLMGSSLAKLISIC